MSKISIEGNASGSGTFTIASPNSNTNRTLNLPDSSGTVVVTGGAQTIEFADGTNSAPSITNSGDTNTGIYFPGADRIGFTEGGTQCGEFDASGNFQFNSGYGSVAIAYGCRAWVNFNGTGTVAIREDGNVTSITDNGTGDYTVNFTNAMPDANYVFAGAVANTNDNWVSILAGATRGVAGIQQAATAPTTLACRIQSAYGSSATAGSNGALADFSAITFVVFR